MRKLTTAAVVLFTASTAFAADPVALERDVDGFVVLPVTDERPFADLQSADGLQNICRYYSATNQSACDIPGGEYRLVTYTASWSGVSSRVIAPPRGDTGPSDGPTIVHVSETFLVTTPEPNPTVSVACPEGSIPTGGACSGRVAVILGGEIDSLDETVGMSSALTATGYACPFQKQVSGVSFIGEALRVVVTAACFVP